MGIASLVVSIIAIILSVIPIVGLPVALIALILAIIAMCRKKNKEVYRGLKIAGLIVAIIAFLVSILMTVPIVIGAYIVVKNNQAIIDKANEAVEADKLNQVQQLAKLLWAEAYLDEVEDIEGYILGKLEEQGIDINKYDIEVTLFGVTVKEKTASDSKDENMKDKIEDAKDNDKFNSYEKYENVKWCGKETSIKDAMFLKIEDNNIVFVYAGKTSKYRVEDGTPKSVTSWINGGIPVFLLLTEEGKVYEVLQEDEDYKVTGLLQLDSLRDYKIIDMTGSVGGVVVRPVYYLTLEGKLIDSNGFTYEELNLDFVSSFGHFYPIYFDKDGHMSYTDNSNDEELVYLPVKDDYNKEAVAKKVFWQFSTIHNDLSDKAISERYAIITDSNKLVYLTDNGDVMIERSKVKSYKIDKVKDEEWGTYRYNVAITMENNEKITLYDTQDYYYDVEKDENIYFE